MSARQPLAMAPVSRPMAHLLHELQAQIIREAADRADEDGAIVLKPGALSINRYSYHDGDFVRLSGENGRYVQMVRRRFIPESWVGSVPWHPSHWRCEESRLDASGLRWGSEQRVYVTDDFGDLQEVAT